MITHDHNMQLPDSGTWFASAARYPAESLPDLTDYLNHNPISKLLLASVDCYWFILNELRQVLVASPTVIEAFGYESNEDLAGLRPGEIFGCIHSNETINGCGTSKSCSTCGAIITLLSSQILDQTTHGECLLSTHHKGVSKSHEYSVTAAPLHNGGTSLTIFTLKDISANKRRNVLESFLFHDLDNIVCKLRGWEEILVKKPHDVAKITHELVYLSTYLSQEIDYLKNIYLAEQGELQVTLGKTLVSNILDDFRSLITELYPDKANLIVVQDCGYPLTVLASPPLLHRILLNMTINAFEATTSQELIQVRFEEQVNGVCFKVHNPGEMSETAKLQIFKRSFSTKMPHGRGLGTYSMKLFGEQYLNGDVGFSSSIDDGTTFYITLPVNRN